MTIASIVKSEAGNKNRSRDWYRGTLAQVLQNYQGPEYDDPDSDRDQSGPAEAGEMYFFNYIATKPNRLKYYDQFPVTYIINTFPDGFLGANLHYLAPKLRQGVALSLLNSGDGVVVPNKTLHRYYFGGIQGGMMRVPEAEMADVSLLPTEKFVTPNGVDYPSYRVWRDK